ncbi:MAG: hypothetical protein ACHQC8_01270 [Solirubrobacterales bacterium]
MICSTLRHDKPCVLHGLQEFFAGVGIAIGVALMSGVLIASQSITSLASLDLAVYGAGATGVKPANVTPQIEIRR